MSHKLHRPLALALTAVAGLAVAACGGKTVNSEELADQIREQMSAQAGVDPDQVKVECPDDIEVEEGRKFECDLTAPNGDPVIVEVTLVDEEGTYEAVVPPEQFEK
jgi:hypothetical protein